MSALGDLRRLAAAWRAARSEPVLVNRHGKPALVVLSVEEYARLNQIRDDPIGMRAPPPRTSWFVETEIDANRRNNKWLK
jgi:hypothetical protein